MNSSTLFVLFFGRRMQVTEVVEYDNDSAMVRVCAPTSNPMPRTMPVWIPLGQLLIESV